MLVNIDRIVGMYGKQYLLSKQFSIIQCNEQNRKLITFKIAWKINSIEEAIEKCTWKSSKVIHSTLNKWEIIGAEFINIMNINLNLFLKLIQSGYASKLYHFLCGTSKNYTLIFAHTQVRSPIPKLCC